MGNDDLYTSFLKKNFEASTYSKYDEHTKKEVDDMRFRHDEIVVSRKYVGWLPWLIRIPFKYFGFAGWSVSGISLLLILSFILSLRLKSMNVSPTISMLKVVSFFDLPTAFIQSTATNIFTAFIALLGLLSVFFVFKIQSQRNRTRDGVNSLYLLIKEYREKYEAKYIKKSPCYKDLKTNRNKFSTKDLLIWIHNENDKCFSDVESLKESWIYTVNSLYIGHINRNYFFQNLYVFTFIILLSMLIMPRVIFSKTFLLLLFYVDISVAFISVLYVLFTLKVMVVHEYPMGYFKEIHEDKGRGLGHCDGNKFKRHF